MSDYHEYRMRAEETQALAANVHAPVLKQALLELMTTYWTLARHAPDCPELSEDAVHAEEQPGPFYGTLIDRSDQQN